jgi:hypothetical protein
MNDDDLLKRLGDAARTEQDEDPRWERYALGTATAAERAALEALEGDDARTKREAYRPLDDAALDRIAARIAPVTPARTAAERTPAVIASVASSAATVARGPASWFRRVGVIAGPLVLAAGIALFLATPSASPLAHYEVTASGGEQAMRAPAPASSVLHVGAHDARVELVVRPASGERDVEAHAFAVRGDSVEPWTSTSETSAEGAVRITGTSASLAGASQIRVVVGHPQALGDASDQLEKARQGAVAGRGWQVLSVALVLSRD